MSGVESVLAMLGDAASGRPHLEKPVNLTAQGPARGGPESSVPVPGFGSLTAEDKTASFQVRTLGRALLALIYRGPIRPVVRAG